MGEAARAVDVGRLALMAHYVIARTEPEKLGATKLNKVLWYADLEHYRRHGRSLTGLTGYVRMPRGPVPPKIGEALSRLKAEGQITERSARVYSYHQRQFVWLQEPKISELTAEEIDILTTVISALHSKTADEVSELTHEDLWEELSDGDVMPIGAASISVRPPSAAELAWAERQ